MYIWVCAACPSCNWGRSLERSSNTHSGCLAEHFLTTVQPAHEWVESLGVFLLFLLKLWAVEVNNFWIVCFQNLGKSCFLANCHSYWPPAWQTNRERLQLHKTTITRTVNLWKAWLWNMGSSWRPRWNPQAETCRWSNKADLYTKCCLSFDLRPLFLSMLFVRRWSCAGKPSFCH